MDTGRTLLSPGVRTLPAHGFRAALGAALSGVLGDATLWLYGTLGYSARGGLLVLALPILTVPTPVTLSIIFRSVISTSGDRNALAAVTFLAVVGLGVALLAGLLLAAFADVSSFERLVADPETDDVRGGRDGQPLSARRRRRLVLWLAGVQAMALVPAGIALGYAYQRLEAVIRSELILPSSLHVPLVVRIADQLRTEVVVLVAAVALAEALYGLVSRRLLVVAVGLRPDDGGHARWAITVARDGLARLVQRPMSTLGTMAAGWLVSLVVLVPVLWALFVTWSAVRGLYLSPVTSGGLEGAVGGLIITLLLVAMWMASLILAGFASALRGSLWTVEALR